MITWKGSNWTDDICKTFGARCLGVGLSLTHTHSPCKERFGERQKMAGGDAQSLFPVLKRLVGREMTDKIECNLFGGDT